MATQQATTTDHSRSHVGFIPFDMPLSAALALCLPYDLPKTDAHCRARYGKPGKRIVIHTHVEELT